MILYKRETDGSWRLTGEPTDDDPFVLVITQPTAGATVAGTTLVKVQTNPEYIVSGIAVIDVLRDGTKVGEFSPPAAGQTEWTFNWNTNPFVTNGAHTLQARATLQAGGLVIHSEIRNVTVSNSTSPPFSASFASPGANGQTFSNLMNIVAIVDGTLPSGYTTPTLPRFYLDNALIGPVTSGPFGPWINNFDTTAFANGSHTLKAEFDWVGPSSTSGTVTSALRTLNFSNVGAGPFDLVWGAPGQDNEAIPPNAVYNVVVTEDPAYVGSGSTPAADAAIAVANGFPTRKLNVLDRLAALSGGWFDFRVLRGMAKLERERIKAAGSRIQANIDAGNTDIINGASDCSQTWDDHFGTGPDNDDVFVYHNGPLTLCIAYLAFSGNLLTSAAATAIKNSLRTRWCVHAFGHTNNASMCIIDANPYNPANDAGATGNHRLQKIVCGLLLSEVFAGESFNVSTHGVSKAAKATGSVGDPNSTLSWFHYYRDAFYRYMRAWSDGLSNKFGRDNFGIEQDTIGYAHMYLGDYLALANWCTDASLKKQAEEMYDRLLLTFTEKYAGRGHVRGGGSQRIGGQDYVSGSPLWITDYLLFDNFGGEPGAVAGQSPYYSSWGQWAHEGLVFGSYVPTDARFPKGIIQLAREKGSGYLVKESDRRNTVWVEKDFAMGWFGTGRTGKEDSPGAISVDNNLAGGVSQILPFQGNGPFNKDQSGGNECSAVVTKRAMVARAINTASTLPRLWVSDGTVSRGVSTAWSSVDETRTDWLFLSRVTSKGRTVYVGIRQAGGTRSKITLATGATSYGGDIYQFSHASHPFIIEIGTSDDYASFTDFKNQLIGNPLTVGSRVVYTSRQTGAVLDFDASAIGARNHRINGSTLNTAEWGHAVHGLNHEAPFGTYRMNLRNADFTADWNWNPGGGEVNIGELPTKTLVTVAGTPTNPIVSRELFIDGQLAGNFTDGGFGPTFAWDTTGFVPGSHTLSARWILQDGTVVRSAPRTVTLSLSSSGDLAAQIRLMERQGFQGESANRRMFEERIGRFVNVTGRFCSTTSWGTVDSGSGRGLTGVLGLVQGMVDELNTQHLNGDRSKCWLTLPMLVATPLSGSDLRTLAYGAQGGYDDIAHKLGVILDMLIDKKKAGIRFGWEGGASWFLWGIRNARNGATFSEAALYYSAYYSRVKGIVDGHLGAEASQLLWDWNGTGGVATNPSERAAWELAYPTPNEPDVISCDSYHMSQFVQGWTNANGQDTHVPVSEVLAWISEFAGLKGKKTALSEGSAFSYKYQATAVPRPLLSLRTTEHESNLAFLDMVLDWGLAECRIDRLSHIMWFERDPYGEGFFAFVTGMPPSKMVARLEGEERVHNSLKLMHPSEHKRKWGLDVPPADPQSGYYAFFNATGTPQTIYQAAPTGQPAGYAPVRIPGAVPFGVAGMDPPDTLSFRAGFFTLTTDGLPGGPRGTDNGHTNAPLTATRYLNRVGGPIPDVPS